MRDVPEECPQAVVQWACQHVDKGGATVAATDDGPLQQHQLLGCQPVQQYLQECIAVLSLPQ